MYYVLQVAPGMEERTERLIRGRVKKTVYGRCFHPMRHVKKKFGGEWKDCHEKLLPGYIFITSNLVEALYQELRQVPGLTKILGKESDYFVSLEKTEAVWLEKWMKGEGSEKSEAGNRPDIEKGRSQRKSKQTKRSQTEIELSQIQVEADAFTVLSGPLKGMENEIVKLHLHKRLAEVEVEFMGEKKRMYLGIELTEKRKIDYQTSEI